MATLSIRPPYTDDELAKSYPKHLELQQVQILLRHGERTPVSARFENAGLSANWPYCNAANAMKSALRAADGSWDALTWTRKLESLGVDDAPRMSVGPQGESEGICQPGELTDVGRQTTLALGKRTRRLYIERLGFLPPVLDAQSAPALTLRATPIPRALESVQQAFTGLYPPATRAAGGPLPVIVARKLQDETLFPNEGACKRFKELARAFADRAAQLRNSGPELAYINQKIGKWMPTDSPILKVDSHPRLTGVMDTINATDAHGSATKLPEEFYDAKVRAGVDRLCVEEWFAGYQESNEYRRLGIGALMGDLTQRMIERTRANEAESFKMSLAGCHDTTLAASLAALGIFDVRKDKWPNFTSSIAFELFKRKTLEATRSEGAPNGTVSPSTQKIWWSSWFSWPGSREDVPARLPIKDWSDAENRKLNDFYVRLRYNDTPVTIPYCQIAGRHLESDETFCTLSAFKEAADSFTPKSWKEECGLNLGKPAVPTIIEPPPGVRGSKLI